MNQFRGIMLNKPALAKLKKVDAAVNKLSDEFKTLVLGKSGDHPCEELQDALIKLTDVALLVKTAIADRKSNQLKKKEK